MSDSKRLIGGPQLWGIGETLDARFDLAQCRRLPGIETLPLHRGADDGTKHRIKAQIEAAFDLPPLCVIRRRQRGQ